MIVDRRRQATDQSEPRDRMNSDFGGCKCATRQIDTGRCESSRAAGLAARRERPTTASQRDIRDKGPMLVVEGISASEASGQCRRRRIADGRRTPQPSSHSERALDKAN